MCLGTFGALLGSETTQNLYLIVYATLQAYFLRYSPYKTLNEYTQTGSITARQIVLHKRGFHEKELFNKYYIPFGLKGPNE